MKHTTHAEIAETMIAAINERLASARSLPLTKPQEKVVRAVVEESLIAFQLAGVLR